MSGEQEWIGQTDSWPTSSLSPGVSPQPSPDSQTTIYPSSESIPNIYHLNEKSTFPNQAGQQPLTLNYQQSSFISQSNQPVVKDNHQQHLTTNSQVQYPRAEPPQQTFNNTFIPSSGVQAQTKNLNTISSGNPSPVKHPVRYPTPPVNSTQAGQLPQPTFPPQGHRQSYQSPVSNQGFRNPQVNNLLNRPPRPTSQNTPQRVAPVQQQFSQRPRPPVQTVRQHNPQSTLIRGPRPTESSNIRPGNQSQSQQFTPRSMSQTFQNAPRPVRPQPHHNIQTRPPRLITPIIRQQIPNPNACRVAGQPPPSNINANAFSRPPFPVGVNQPGNVRFMKGNNGPPPLDGARPSGMGAGPFDEMDDFDEYDEDEMYDEDDDDYDEEEDEMFNFPPQNFSQQQNRPPNSQPQQQNRPPNSQPQQQNCPPNFHQQQNRPPTSESQPNRPTPVADRQQSKFPPNFPQQNHPPNIERQPNSLPKSDPNKQLPPKSDNQQNSINSGNQHKASVPDRPPNFAAKTDHPQFQTDLENRLNFPPRSEQQGINFPRQKNFPSNFDQHQRFQFDDDADTSDEEQMLLEELVSCEDEEHYNSIHQKLSDMGVTEEEIVEFKESYNLTNPYHEEEEMDFYNDMDEEDYDGEEEERVSSSSMMTPRSAPNPIQQPPATSQHQGKQAPLIKRLNVPCQPTIAPTVVCYVVLGNRPPQPQTSFHGTVRAPGIPKMSSSGPNNNANVRPGFTTPLGQRKPTPESSHQPTPQTPHNQRTPSVQPGVIRTPAPASQQRQIAPSPQANTIISSRVTAPGQQLQEPRMRHPVSNPTSSQTGQNNSQSSFIAHHSQPQMSQQHSSASQVTPGISRPPLRPNSPRFLTPVHQQPPIRPRMSGSAPLPRISSPSKMSGSAPLPRISSPSKMPLSDADQSRQLVLQMQQKLDEEILAKKQPQPENTTFPQHLVRPGVGTNQRFRPPTNNFPPFNNKLRPRVPVNNAGRGARPMAAGIRNVKPNDQARFQGPVRQQHPPPLAQAAPVSSTPIEQPSPNANRFNTPQTGGATVSNVPQSQAPSTSGGARMANPGVNAVPPSAGTVDQQNASKGESRFNLGGLSEDKCILKGRQKLVVGNLYYIRSPIDQSMVLARWNGERFDDLSPAEQKQVEQMQAKPASTTSKVDTQTTPPTTTKADNVTTEAAGSNQSTYVKPLPKDNTTSIPASSDKTDKEPEEKEEEEEDEDIVFKRPLNDDEDYYRVCKHCGYTSQNFKRCDGCSRMFQGEVKIHIIKKNSLEPTLSPPSDESDVKLTTQDEMPGRIENNDNVNIKSPSKFYGNAANRRGRGGRRGMVGRARGGGSRGRIGRGQGVDGYESSDPESPFDQYSTDSMGSQPGRKRATRGRGKGPAGRKRAKKMDEPVTVEISSDEDEPSSTSNSFYGIPQSPASSSVGSSPIFPAMASEPMRGFGRFRRTRMQDQEGQSKLRKKLEEEDMQLAMDDDDDDGAEPPTYQFEIRSIRIGSMRTKPEDLLHINMRGMCFNVKSERTDESFECEIMSSEVTHVKYYGGENQPLLFMMLTQDCVDKFRTVFRMTESEGEYLDPNSDDMKQRMVVIIFEALDYIPQDVRETLSLWSDINNVSDSDFIEDLTEESSNDLLIQTAPPILTLDADQKGYLKREPGSLAIPRAPNSPQNAADNEPDSTSGSPPQIRRYFEGPPIRLLKYPPTRGIAITTEDLFCLNEGEFLNDVIIDFYLQYLYREMMTEDMQNRTHIFSSFFYKRLTQKDRHERTEEDAKKSLPERRHARVKKWTKTVDLFSKDFIIVPINEHSHWYLAVICFPGLANAEVVRFIPSVGHRDQPDDPSPTPEGETPEDKEKETPEEGSSSQPEKRGKVVFGKQLDADESVKEEENNCCLGQKQPCILIFDSLLGPSRNPNVRMLREYLQCEWNAKKSEARNISKLLRGSTPKVPQQSNFSDCGVYLLQYVESFFEDPIADFQIPMKGLQHWFTEDLINPKREEIHNLIMNLHRQFQEDRGDPNILDIPYESAPPSPPYHPHDEPFLPHLPPEDEPLPPHQTHQEHHPHPPLSVKPLLPVSEDSADSLDHAASNVTKDSSQDYNTNTPIAPTSNGSIQKDNAHSNIHSDSSQKSQGDNNSNPGSDKQSDENPKLLSFFDDPVTKPSDNVNGEGEKIALGESVNKDGVEKMEVDNESGEVVEEQKDLKQDGCDRLQAEGGVNYSHVHSAEEMADASGDTNPNIGDGNS